MPTKEVSMSSKNVGKPFPDVVKGISVQVKGGKVTKKS
jgi:hypothetical protein